MGCLEGAWGVPLVSSDHTHHPPSSLYLSLYMGMVGIWLCHIPTLHHYDIFPPGGNMTGGNMLVGPLHHRPHHNCHGFQSSLSTYINSTFYIIIILSVPVIALSCSFNIRNMVIMMMMMMMMMIGTELSLRTAISSERSPKLLELLLSIIWKFESFSKFLYLKAWKFKQI